MCSTIINSVAFKLWLYEAEIKWTSLYSKINIGVYALINCWVIRMRYMLAVYVDSLSVLC